MLKYVIALTLASTVAANAGNGPMHDPPYIGQVIHFYGFQDPVGCRNPRMAFKLSRLKDWQQRAFANDLRLHGERDSSCTLLRESGDEEWRIAAIERVKDKPQSWLCVESTIDYRPAEEIKRKPLPPDPTSCFWILGHLEK
jgi:hypothetical protein